MIDIGTLAGRLTLEDEASLGLAAFAGNLLAIHRDRVFRDEQLERPELLQKRMGV